MTIGLAGAFIGGILTLLSPCSVMVLPAFFAYAFNSAGKLLARTGLFYLGLALTLIPLGLLAGSFGSLLHRETLLMIAAILLIVLGGVQLLGLRIPTLVTGTGGTTTASVFVLGAAYGLLGTCSGPILGAVLTVAAVGADPLYGAVILAVFGLGMTVPLFALSLLWSRFPKLQNWLKPREVTFGKWRNSWTAIIAGAAAVAIGVFLLIVGDSNGGVLTATQQFHLENWLMNRTANIGDLAVVGVVVAVVAVGALGAYWWKRKRRRRFRLRPVQWSLPKDPSSAPDKTTTR